VNIEICCLINCIYHCFYIGHDAVLLFGAVLKCQQLGCFHFVQFMLRALVVFYSVGMLCNPAVVCFSCGLFSRRV